MLRKGAILVVAAAMLLGGPALARPFYRLVEPTPACLLLSDARQLTQSETSAKERVGTSCVWGLTGSNFIADRDERGFLCLHYSQGRCLWVPSRAVKRTSFDDGVF
jgi:hypothetical protein